MTIKKVKAGFDGLMKKVYMVQLTEYINKNLSKIYFTIKSTISNLIKSDLFDKDLANKNLDGFINELYNYNVFISSINPV